MLRIVAATLTAVVAGVIYFLRVLYKKRRELDDLPNPPMKNWLLGHLDLAGECQKLFPPKSHIHNWFSYLQKKYALEDCFYLDWWPIGPRWIIMSNPEMISQYITTGNSLPKCSLATDYLNAFLGENNLVSLEGQRWKTLRSIFNPGFSASHLMTLVPYIVDASVVFCDILGKKAENGELFELEESATRLTIDIIGKIVLDSDFDSQKCLHPVVETFRERAILMPNNTTVVNLSQFNLINRFKLWRNGVKLDRLIGAEFDRKLASRTPAEKSKRLSSGRKRCVIDLAMDAYDLEMASSAPSKDQSTQRVDKAFRQNAIDSMKTFIFAGHDTTSSTIAYIFYLLHVHPHVKKKILEELDRVYSAGCTTATIATQIKSDPFSINKLEYINAVIKETLRLFPPASTLRMVPKASSPSETLYMTHPATGKKLPLSGWNIWPAAHFVGRNDEFFPKPAHFIPERFIPSMTPFQNSKLFTPAGKDAWRPFERGPRNCIGQELAMIESRIIVALVIKDFDFVPEYDGVKIDSWTPIETYKEFANGQSGAERMTIEGHRPFQVLIGAGKPQGRMPGRMHFRNS